MPRTPIVPALAALALLAGAPAPMPRADAAEFRTLTDKGRELDYLIALPPGFDWKKPHPVLLVLPPGNQSRELAQTALDRYWEAEGTSRGWVIVAPIAQKERTFHSGLERAIPFLLDEVQRSVVFEGGKAHLAGVSNGGKSAFRVATEYPDRFHSLTVLPGFPPDNRAELGLRSLKQLSGGVAMYVGEQDPKWITPMREVKQKLDAYGVPATLELWPASEHVVNIKAVELFDMLETKRVRPAESAAVPTEPPPGTAPATGAPAEAPPAVPGSVAGADPVPGANPALPQPAEVPVPVPAEPAPAPPAPAPAPPTAPPTPSPSPATPPAPVSTTPIEQQRATMDIGVVLDDFHDAAAKADFNRYFAHFTPEAVFLGTDATERWTLDQFKAFAKPYFDSGKGWAYVSTARTVTLAPVVTPGAEIAWFDELLRHQKYGVCRGSGVLRREGGAWKVAQYNLSFPIPNDLADEITGKIVKHQATPAAGN